MKNYEYKMTIIVPVYNAEQYLHTCVEAILSQSMEYSDYEVLLIDDGSSDSSLDICYKYSSIYSMFKVITKENEGVSKTRNLGLNLAKGKYILYLDSDDRISENTLTNIWNFFEKNEENVDLVTYPLVKYNEKNEKVGKIHHRYNYLKTTGVYQLSDVPFIVQTTMNICVKNTEEKCFFDENLAVHEDQDYITRIVMQKGTIGFVKEAEYCYIQHSNSVMNQISAIELWFPTIGKYEEMFSEYDEVPRYLQALFFNDIKWKMVSDILYPSHLPKEEYDEQIDRLKSLLEKVDVDVIMKYPDTDIFHRFYWLSMKNNNEIVPISEPTKVALVSGTEILYEKRNIEFIVHRILNVQGKPYLLAFAKSPIFSFGVKPEIYAYEKTAQGENIRQLHVFPSVSSYYKARIKTNDFWSFYYECDSEKVQDVIFKTKIDGFYYDVSYYFMPQCQIDPSKKMNSFTNNSVEISFKDNRFYFNHIDGEAELESKKKLTSVVCKNNPKLSKFREMALEVKDGSRIWLYYDCKGVKKDNGYYQFIHDIKKEDGIERYYVSDNSREMQNEVFDEELRKRVVQFGSFYHKLLYVNAEKLIVAFIETNNYCPFTASEFELLKDLFKYQIVYLQHGILHAHMPWKYSPEKINIDKIVVSSNYEIGIFTNTYGFRENMLIKSGMPRYDHFDRMVEPKNKILFAPTWRKYLIGDCKDNVWELKENVFVKSKYYHKIMGVLNSVRLTEILEKYNVELDFKLHPIFQPYAHLFESDSERVHILRESQKDDEYKVFITDFSSYVFDFAYRKMNILYFVPDEAEFKVGLNGYRELDLPFEDAFGDYITEDEILVEKVIEIIERNFSLERKYEERMEKFYLPLDNCCEKIYQELIAES